MFEDALDLAENKLILLYIINKIKMPVSNNQITEIILENNFINYFTLQQYLSELVSSKFLHNTDEEGTQRLKITEKGSKVLDLFGSRISQNKLDVANSYLTAHREKIKKETTVHADYTIDDKNNFIVNLNATENGSILINIKLSVGSNKQARELCNKWNSDSSKLYDKIVKMLVNEELL